MTLSIHIDPPPLRVDPDGAVRIGGSRVLLETSLTAYRHGDSAEEIADNFSTLDLADVHAVIAYYLRHRPEVEAYLDHRRHQGKALRRQMQALFPAQRLRERLLARRDALHSTPP